MEKELKKLSNDELENVSGGGESFIFKPPTEEIRLPSESWQGIKQPISR